MEVDFLFGSADLQTPRPQASVLKNDLHVDVLLRAMAGEDRRMADACEHVLLHPLTDRDAILARAAVRMDAAAYPGLFSVWLSAARTASDGAARYAEFQKPRYDHVISNQKKLLTEIQIARLYLQSLRQISTAACAETGAFRSPAVRAFVRDIARRYGEQTIARMEARLDLLDTLRRSDDLTLRASVGFGLRPANVTLQSLAGQDNGARARSPKGETAVPLSSVALGQNAEDAVQSAVLPLLRATADLNRGLRRFFDTLTFQLCFYVGCTRLRERLAALGAALCEPDLLPGASGVESDNLRGVGLMLQENKLPSGNDARFAGKRLILVTGVNQGGKTSFLRSFGLAQLMAQCGLFVTAEAYRCPLYDGVYTHFPAGEDTDRGMGLLDVELRRLSKIVDCIKPHSLLLLNETFQTTMPQDAKYLAEVAVQAIVDCGVTVLFVTHLYAYAASLYAQRRPDVLFLRAGRGDGRQPAYLLQEGRPYASAEGEALYREVLNA